MARNKNSTALFDVIHSAKKPPKASPSAAIPTPKWWGKDKKVPRQSAPESTENAGRQQSWLSAAKRSAGLSVAPPHLEPAPPAATGPVIEPFYSEQPPAEAEPDALDSAAEIEITSISPPPKPRFIDRFKNRPVQTPPAIEELIVPPPIVEEPLWTPPLPEPEIKPDRQPDDREAVIKLDPNAGDIRFRLSYGGIIALVLILLIALAIAFVAGTRSSSTAMFNDSPDATGTPATAPTSGMMAAMEPAKSTDTSPVHPDVLQVAPRSAIPVAQQITAAAPQAPSLPIKSTRDIGMIYVVVQSYPDQDLAQRACDFMNKSAIPCSLVQGPDGWAPRDWYSVVGLQPFAKHDAGLPEYERAVKAAGIRFTTKIMDQFQPQAYTWRETSDLSQQ